ncbi:hypothetical protein TNCT_407591 [Trichonephila clavata]|uniref:Uncharacterized protein n=1 Tax=Trichonephila clavata TaxID=2740835 RepID=A0A8X6J673_TRICU|nr:hypothetical protein TNCT_407591 [Trichonephila clavata]
MKAIQHYHHNTRHFDDQKNFVKASDTSSLVCRGTVMLESQRPDRRISSTKSGFSICNPYIPNFANSAAAVFRISSDA